MMRSPRVRILLWIAGALVPLALAPGVASASTRPREAKPAHSHKIAKKKEPKITVATVRNHVLALTDLSPGWSVNNTTSNGSGLGASKCLAPLKKRKGQKTVQATVSYDQSSNLPVIEELLAAGPDVNSAYGKVTKALATCKAIAFKTNGKTLHGTIGQMSFAPVGQRSVAYALGLTIDKVHVGLDLVVFRAANYVGLFAYGDLGTPNVTVATAYAKEAAAKAEGQSVSPPTTTGTSPTG